MTAQDGSTRKTYRIDVTANIPRIEVHLGATPLVDASPTRVDLGDAGLGFFTERTFTLKNTGLVPLTVQPVTKGGTDGNVGFTIAASGGSASAGSDYTPPIAAQTILHSVNSKSVPITIHPAGASEPNETFTVTLTSATGGATLGAVKTVSVRIIDALDDADPFLPVVTSPALNALVNSDQANALLFTASGTARDNKGVARVQVELNGTGFEDATLTAPGALNTSWTHVFLPVAGPNTLTVQSTDTLGRTSQTVTRSFRGACPLEVSVEDNSMGSVTSSYLGKTFREVGKSYTLTATPKSGHVFYGWIVGGVSPEDAGLTQGALEMTNLTFVHREGLTLMATFVPNPFGAAAGTYNGLIRTEGGASSQATEGGITLTLQKTGGFSGKITMDGQVVNVVGLFHPDGHARYGTQRSRDVIVTRPSKPRLVLNLHLDFTLSYISGSVFQFNRATIVHTSVVGADRAAFQSAPAPELFDILVPFLGNNNATATYNVLCQITDRRGLIDGTEIPTGTGFGSITVAKSGVVTFTGSLPDGTQNITASSTLSDWLQTGFFIPLYNKGGFVSIPLDLIPDNEDFDMGSNAVLWSRPYQDTHHYPWGWPEVLGMMLGGARYEIPPGESVLRLPSGSLYEPSEYGNAVIGFTSPMFEEFPWTLVNVYWNDSVDMGDPTIKLSITRKTGRISGTFINPDDGTKMTYQGIMYQKGTLSGAHGWFLTPTPKVKTYNGWGGSADLIGLE